MRVYIGGTFDLPLHPGHKRILRAARDISGGDGEVVVGLNTDAFVFRFKGAFPKFSYLMRSEALSESPFVTRVVPNVGDEDSRVVLDVILPDVLLAGPDWYSEDDSRYCAQMGFSLGWLEERGISLRYLSQRVPGWSSTAIKAGDIR